MEGVEAVLDADLRIEEPEQPIALKNFADAVVFEKVGFRYLNADRDAVTDINFTIPRGKVIALVGASGAGKSTLADLLPRFYDPNTGRILIDGTDIRDVSTKDLRALCGIVSQEPILFNDTVANNIAFGDTSATPEAIQQRLRQPMHMNLSINCQRVT